MNRAVRLVLFGSLTLSVAGLRADDAAFPKASGDLADDANWVDANGDAIAHGETTDWLLSQSDGAYTIGTDDLRFLSLSWTKSATIDLSATPFTKAEFARAQAALPTTVRCSLAKQGNKILLTLRPARGLSLLVR